MTAHPRLVELKPSAWTYIVLFFVAPLSLFLLFALVLFTIGPLGVSSVGPIEIVSSKTYTPETILILLALWVVVMFLCRLVWLALFVRISRVGYIVREGLIFLQPFFGKKRTLSLEEISGFSQCPLPWWLQFRWGGEGLALYLVDGTHIQLNEISFNNISLLTSMLRHSDVKYLGAERCWFYPFAKRKFRFDSP